MQNMWPKPKSTEKPRRCIADRGQAQKPRQAANTSAEPSQARPRIVAAVDPAPHLQGREDRDNGKASGDDAEPDDGKAEFDGPVGGGDADDEDQRLDQRDVSQERDEQLVIDVALARD